MLFPYTSKQANWSHTPENSSLLIQPLIFPLKEEVFCLLCTLKKFSCLWILILWKSTIFSLITFHKNQLFFSPTYLQWEPFAKYKEFFFEFVCLIIKIAPKSKSKPIHVLVPSSPSHSQSHPQDLLGPTDSKPMISQSSNSWFCCPNERGGEICYTAQGLR